MKKSKNKNKAMDSLMAAFKKREAADATEFNSYAEGWIRENIEVSEILSLPGVMNIVLEHYHNDILHDFKINQAEEREIEALREEQGEIDPDDPDYEDKMDERLTSDQFKRKYYYR